MIDNSVSPTNRTGADQSSKSGSASPDNRLLEIDRMKGLAILLVVWGHVPSASISGPALWYYVSISGVYAFHMPLFMYLSGFVFFMVGGPDRFWRSPLKQIATRFDRLMVPFLAFGILIVTGKYLANSFSEISDPVKSLSDGLFKVIDNTPDNPLLSIWYLLVLFIYTIIVPIFWRFGGRKIYLIILFGIIGWIFPFPEEYYLKRIATFLIFFGIGGLFAIKKDIILPVLSKYYLYFLSIFLFVLYETYDSQYALLLCGASSICALHGLFLQNFWNSDRLFLGIGRNSMAIYLLNTIFIGMAKLFIGHFSSHNLALFLAMVALLNAVGIFGPIAVRLIMNGIPATRPITRYLD